ncbi:hypothetical protein D7D52_24405 [Nocardia yunnanensis]|uniref:DUF559 domain-containing protein n=2 Tax=Nocardia yunnanensis TaxID=2382165 RepID=A0A386ZFQ7_9NOCA|nr:hypothetical protein D7D52_24405 [Nocardia yunnanensis]
MAAAACWGGDQAVLVGFSALALHWVGWFAEEPAEIVAPGTTRAPNGIVARQYDLLPDEVWEVGRLRVFSAARTGYDLARGVEFEKAVVAVDALCHATRLDPAAIVDRCAEHPGARGIRALQKVISYVDAGAESPQETRTRLLLMRAGFPRPTTQIPVYRPDGRFVARLDMGWPQWKVAVEYDGAQHWTDRSQYTKDIDRHADLHTLGWTLIRAAAPTSTPAPSPSSPE